MNLLVLVEIGFRYGLPTARKSNTFFLFFFLSFFLSFFFSFFFCYFLFYFYFFRDNIIYLYIYKYIIYTYIYLYILYLTRHGEKPIEFTSLVFWFSGQSWVMLYI